MPFMNINTRTRQSKSEMSTATAPDGGSAHNSVVAVMDE